jgi:hypothetical protein
MLAVGIIQGLMGIALLPITLKAFNDFFLYYYPREKDLGDIIIAVCFLLCAITNLLGSFFLIKEKLT